MKVLASVEVPWVPATFQRGFRFLSSLYSDPRENFYECLRDLSLMKSTDHGNDVMVAQFVFSFLCSLFRERENRQCY